MLLEHFVPTRTRRHIEISFSNSRHTTYVTFVLCPSVKVRSSIMGLDGYVGGFETQQRARRLQEERDERAREFEVRKQQQQQQQQQRDDGGGSRGGFNNRSSSLVGFRGSSTVEEEKAFANQSVGLLTREEYAKKQEKVRLELEKEREAKERTRREKRERQKAKDNERKRKEKNLLSFHEENEEEEEEEEQKEEEEEEEERRAKKKVKKRSSIGVNPDANTSHVPNAQKEQMEEERVLRDQLAREFLEKKRKQMEENLTVTFSYWSGGGGRRSVTVKQKDTIRTFLKTAMKSMEEEFRELSKLSVESMMYVKEDCIIPHELTFYELISRKARGKSGPLFRFDDKEDVRLVGDASVEKEDSHPGKIFHRSWYDKNKHIFPASRWEVFDFSKDFSTYTIHGMGEKKAWER